MIRLSGILALAAACLCAGPPERADAATGPVIKIPLPPSTKLDRQQTVYRCQADKPTRAARQALHATFPNRTVTVTYLNADDISLAIVPISGRTQVFSNVIAADGAKYVAADYTWWTKGDTASLTAATNDALAITCTERPSPRR